ncbi:hypothetical protein DITRI_Ditri09bG0058600 [Diplodiscus trichospermus]
MSLLEALSLIREVVVSKSLDFLVEKMVSVCSEFLKFPSNDQIQEELEKLKKEMQRIRSLLDDAEARQLRDHSVKILLSEIQNWVYDVDDIVDELETEASRRKLMERRGSSSKRRRLSFHPFNDPRFRRDMMSKIEDANAKLNNLKPWIKELKLMRVTGGQNFNCNIPERLPSTSLVVERHVYGRDKDKGTILELVLNSDDQRSFVIPIIGMGGIGKTTLAQVVYNDDAIQNHFDLKAWVCVSDYFDVTRITKTILQSVTSDSTPCNDNDLNSLQEKLKEKLSGKKFLIVLDDVWNENYHDWTVLQAPFLVGTAGSKIIVTTRNSAVSSIMGASYTHSLEVLSEDDCLSLLAQHALAAEDFEGHPDLKEVAKKIVRKCNGLPLAVRTLGGLLRANVNHDAWKNISQSEIWELPNERDGIIPALHMSYHHLPPHLKRCFEYCSILPKDYEFEEIEIILLWRAEGFLQEAKHKHNSEDLGHKYFRDLLSRSLFQRSNKDEFRFVMHDLINDLAQSVAGEICFRIEGNQEIPIHARYSSYIAGKYDGIKKFKGVSLKVRRLRTFLPLRLQDHSQLRRFDSQLRRFVSQLRRFDNDYLTNDVQTQLLPKLTCLRVLSLEEYYITELSDLIGNLKHLRYLNFSYTPIKCLPESITTLYNLETLLLRECRCLEKLPSEMENLVNLCYLDITGANGLESMPSNFSTLTDLQTLSNFILREGKGCQIRKLENLSNLKGQLCISGLKNVAKTQDAGKAKLHDKLKLDKLELWWCESIYEICPENRRGEMDKGVLDSLRPSKKLKELVLRGYSGVRLAEWIGDSSFNKLQSLCLENCLNCTSLPSIGPLPSLKMVCIRGLQSVTSVGVEFFGKNATNAFPLLESLEFEDMPKWENWNFIEVDEEVRKFPRLRELLILRCRKLLGSIPEYIPSLEKLVIKKCEKLVISIQSLPMLSELEIEGCHKVVCKGFVDGSSLKRVSFSYIPKFICAAEWPTSVSIKVESLEINNCEELCSLQENNWKLLTRPMSLGTLSIVGFLQIVSIGVEEAREEEMQLKIPSSIQQLEIQNCERLEKLSTTLHYVTSLSVLKLMSCSKLISLSKSNLPWNLKILEINDCKNLLCLLEERENGNISNDCLLEQVSIQNCPKLIFLSNDNLPSNLKSLIISNCLDLRCLLEEGENVNISNARLLEQLNIRGCPKLISLSNYNLPSKLKELKIIGCKNLRSLVEEGENVDISNSCLLERLYIDCCLSLVSLSSRGKLPRSLKQMKLRTCPKLESIAQEIQDNSSLEFIEMFDCSNINNLPQGLNKLSHLQRIDIHYCSNFVSFPESGLPTSNLKVLTLIGCEKLQALPHGIYNLSCLEKLEIQGCLSVRSFPEEGIPTNLQELTIEGPDICKPLIEWGLHRLTSLHGLSIIDGCPDVVSFPQEEIGMTLPCSLTHLSLSNFPKLEILSSKGFQDLTSLEYLSIDYCPSLKSLPEKKMLSSLLQLYCDGCPVLKEKYKGPEWSKIAHIPYVVFDSCLLN